MNPGVYDRAHSMDPALWEMLEGDADDEIEAIIRLSHPDQLPPQARVVAQFENIATIRLKRNAVLETRASETCASLKAPRIWCVPELGDTPQGLEFPAPEDDAPVDARRPADLDVTGRGVVIGIADWGCDFAHPNFRREDGRTRLLALWDQRRPQRHAPNRYGYGTIYTRANINQALQSDAPYETLGYHPADGDPGNTGSHCTHVLDIAAGNGRAPGGPVGVAPEADLVCVHLSTRGTGGLANLGDSVTLLEAVDFMAQIAGDRPLVINLSVGRTGGPHLGDTLVEQGLDAFLDAAPGRCIAQSTGNYYANQTHASGRLQPGESHALAWYMDAADITPNEMAIWYAGRDTFTVDVTPPDSDEMFRAQLGERGVIEIDGRQVGRIYHRANDPNNGDNHIDIFLYPTGPAGTWQVTLRGEVIEDGTFHAWVERDAARREYQSRFEPQDVDPMFTTGTICNGFNTVAVGAYNHHRPNRRLAPFSSSGPTRDGRVKPELIAPGVSILAARSAPRDPEADAPFYARKSGTSMASPCVAGTIALMFEAAGRLLPIHETRRLLLDSTEPASAPEPEHHRMGRGYLNIAGAVNAARRSQESTEDVVMNEDMEPSSETPSDALHQGEENLAIPTEPLLEADDLQWQDDLNMLPETWSSSEEAEAEEEEADAALTDAMAYSDVSLGHDEESQDPINLFAYEETEAWEDQRDIASIDAWADSNEPPGGGEDALELIDFWETGEEASDDIIASPEYDETAPDDDELDLGVSLESLVDLADEAVTHSRHTLSSGDLLEQVTSGVLGRGESLSPAEIFDAYAGRDPEMEQHLAQFFEVVAAPGSRLQAPLQAGDILIRRALGEGTLAHLSMLVTGEIFSSSTMVETGFMPEGGRDGQFVQVVEAGAVPHAIKDRFARRLATESGQLDFDQMILRFKSAETAPPDFDRQDVSDHETADLPIEVVEGNQARLTWLDLNLIRGPDGNRHLYYLLTGPGRGRPSQFKLRVSNTNSVYNFLVPYFLVRLRSKRADGTIDVVPFQGARQDGWKRISWRELPDETSRIITFEATPSTLQQAFDPESALTWLDVHFRWREIRESSQRLWGKNTSLALFLVPPATLMFSRGRVVQRSVALNDPQRHQRFWAFVTEKTFSPSDRGPLSVSMSVEASIRSATARGITLTGSYSTTNSASQTIDVRQSYSSSIEAGIDDIIKVGASQSTEFGTSFTWTESRTRSYSRAATQSQTFTQSLTGQKTVSGQVPPPPPGNTRQTMYLYPVVNIHLLPVFEYDRPNALGQATRFNRVRDVPIAIPIGWGLINVPRP